MLVSSSYEIFEWLVAIILEQSSSDFLGIQGYIWDTQSDMFCAFLGSLFSSFFLSKFQDKEILLIKKT